MIRTLPWQASEHAAAVNASLQAYAPPSEMAHHQLPEVPDDER